MYISFYFAVIGHVTFLAFAFNNRLWDEGNFYCNVYIPVLQVQLPNAEPSIDLPKNTEKGDSDSQYKGELKAKEENEGNKDGKGKFESSYDYDKNEWKDLIERLEKTKGLRNNYTEDYEDLLENSGISDSYIQRKRHYEDIIVKDVFPSLEDIEKPFEQVIRQSPETLLKYNKRNQIIEDYRKWANGQEVAPAKTVKILNQDEQKNTPLNFPKNERMKYLDSTLKEPKETQSHRRG